MVEQDTALRLGPRVVLGQGIEDFPGLGMMLHGLFQLSFLHIDIAEVRMGLQVDPAGRRVAEKLHECGYAFLVHACVREQDA